MTPVVAEYVESVTRFFAQHGRGKRILRQVALSIVLCVVVTPFVGVTTRLQVPRIHVTRKSLSLVEYYSSSEKVTCNVADGALTWEELCEEQVACNYCNIPADEMRKIVTSNSSAQIFFQYLELPTSVHVGEMHRVLLAMRVPSDLNLTPHSTHIFGQFVGEELYPVHFIPHAK